jgi:hypothetical protein
MASPFYAQMLLRYCAAYRGVKHHMALLEKIFGKRKSESSAESVWPFSSPQNEATFTVVKILDGDKSILLVHHDDEDGGWQFLTGEPIDMADAKIVGLGEIAKLDPTILNLADMPVGWCARRSSVDNPWSRMKAQPEDA